MARTDAFTILSQQRSGTHFLASLLSSHSGLRVYGEVLHGRSSKGYYAFLRDAADAARGPDQLKPQMQSWRRFVSQLHARDPDFRPGMILMYNQLLRLPADVFSCMVDEPQVIHLVRRNLLRTHVSDAINRAGLKPAHLRADGALSPISLPVEDLAKHLAMRSKTIAAFRGRLAGRPHVEVIYEDVVSNAQWQVDRILSFLGHAREPVRTQLRPTNPQPLAEIITNFEEVRTALRSTEFAWMCAG